MTESILTALLISLLASLILAPVARYLALRWNIVDTPGAHRKHARPVALLGGATILLVSTGVSLLILPTPADVKYVLMAATWMALWGLWDDLKHLPSGIKLVLQIVAAIALIVSGIQVHLPLPAAVNLVLTMLWIVGVCNAINLLDNMDGLAAGISAIAMVFFIIMGMDSGQWALAILAASTLGALLGFLRLNFAPATIYLGDSGSLYLGLLVATLGLQLKFPDTSPNATWLVPIVLLGLPLLDTTLVTVSRLRKGLNPLTSPGHDHISHRLNKMGLSVRQTVILLYVVAMGLGGLALWISRQSPATNAWVAVIFVISVLVTIVWLERTADK